MSERRPVDPLVRTGSACYKGISNGGKGFSHGRGEGVSPTRRRNERWGKDGQKDARITRGLGVATICKLASMERRHKDEYPLLPLGCLLHSNHLMFGRIKGGPLALQHQAWAYQGPQTTQPSQQLLTKSSWFDVSCQKRKKKIQDDK